MTIYNKQVELLVKVLPEIAKEDCFALKGGTAINLFYRDLPRLSVDIDLSYIYFDNREIAFNNIEKALNRICININKLGIKTELSKGETKKIICSDNFVKIKIEPNYTIRGFAYEPQIMRICDKAEDRFGFAKIKVVSKQELYGGKICAALDRQHPRDLFDIYELIKSDAIDEEIVNGFIVMLLGHNRPLHEILNPSILNQETVFKQEFAGMTEEKFTYQDHEETLLILIKTINYSLKKNYKNFLLDFVSLKHNFSNIDIPNLDKLPAIMWKIKNLENLKLTDKEKFEIQAQKLIEYFE